MIASLKELIWAAGFFDGEGSTSRTASVVGGKRYPCVRLSISQNDRRPLDRFCNAVGAGKVYGPYKSPGRNNPIYIWNAASFESMQAVIAMLWKFLSEPKREQIKRCM